MSDTPTRWARPVPRWRPCRPRSSTSAGRPRSAGSAAEDVRRQLVGEFAELSRRALEQNNTQFLELADARMAHAQQAARGDLDQRTQAIEQLLTPLRDQLGRYEQGLRLLELERQKAYTGLSEQVRTLTESQDKLQSETRNLVTALRSPATRGRWGEMQLRRVVEMAGMVEHCDFEQQVTTEGADGTAPARHGRAPARGPARRGRRQGAAPGVPRRQRRHRRGRPRGASRRATPGSCGPTSTRCRRRPTGSSSRTRPSSSWPSSPATRCWRRPSSTTPRCSSTPCRTTSCWPHRRR